MFFKYIYLLVYKFTHGNNKLRLAVVFVIRVFSPMFFFFLFFFLNTMTVFFQRFIPVSLCRYLFFSPSAFLLVIITKMTNISKFLLNHVHICLFTLCLSKTKTFQNCHSCLYYTLKHYFLSPVQSLNVYR